MRRIPPEVVRRSRLGYFDRPGASEYIRIPNQSPAFDRTGPRPGTWTAPSRSMRLVPPQALRRPDGRGRAPARPHAAHLHRGPGQRRRHRPALRPPRQAAGDDRLGAGPRPVEAGHARRASSTAAAERTTATRRSRRSRRSRRCRSSRSRTRAASSSSRPARRAAAPTCRAYIERSQQRIGTPSLVVCLDSGCGNYEQLWCTTSLRGLVGGQLTVEVLTEGVHSGDASGIVPSSFRIAR